MSTRAIFAVKTNDGFDAVYNHSDGYPEGLGAFLEAGTKKNGVVWYEKLITEHPGGFSSVQSGECFCHTHPERGLNDLILVKTMPELIKEARDLDAEYVYVLTPSTGHIDTQKL